MDKRAQADRNAHRDRGDGPASAAKRGYSRNRPVDRGNRMSNENNNKKEDSPPTAQENIEIPPEEEKAIDLKEIPSDVDQTEIPTDDEKAEAEAEEKKAAEEEEKAKDEEIRLLKEFIADVQEKATFKDILRTQNIKSADNRPDESFFTKLDSSVKKNTAFIKKLRSFTDSQKDSLIKDFNGLNLSKYTGELAAAITEAKLKMSDINGAVQLCSLIYCRYAEFSEVFLENWHRILLNKKDEKISNPSKYRVDLRLFSELIAVHVISLKEGLPFLANQLSILVNNDKEEHNNLSIITSFSKHCGDDYVGLIPRKFRLLSEKYNMEIPQSVLLPKERQRACRHLLKDYYTSLCKHLTKEHNHLKSAEKANRKILQTKGELSNERKESFEAAIGVYQKLYQSTLSFSDLLYEPMPELPEEDGKTEEMGMFDFFNPMQNIEFEYDGDRTLFEDEETRSFYETLPELRAYIPGILYRESEQAIAKDEAKDSALEEDLENLQIEDVEMEMETEKIEAEENTKANEGNEQAAKETDQAQEHQNYLKLDMEVEDDVETGSLMKSQYEAYLQSLPNCVNRDLIDKAAIEFCMNFNTKVNRKKLVKGLFTVHRTRYDLLPFYSRLIATLFPCMPEVANDMVQLLKGDFRWHVRKKDQINIESKLKTVRFIGEMVKFKMFPKTESLLCIKMLMFDFSHHNIEMACALLEACGRFLYRSPESHQRTKIYLDVMMRKKAALHLESRYQTMIENAYYYSNPPEVQQSTIKIRPPMHEYIRRLLYKDLSRNTTEKVLRQMRKLNWDEHEIKNYVTKCLTTIWNVKYNAVHAAANLLAGLAPYHETVAIHVVDSVLEDIRAGMEINHPKFNQRRVSCVKYLGELYNYRMVESAVIFKTMYSIITFGVSLEDSQTSRLDPAEHLFRIRLVCVLLETCGQYFDKGSSKRKLDCFLIYFQRYYWYKRSIPIWNEDRPFPVDVENIVIDALETVRPKLASFKSYEEACTAVEELEREFKSKIANVLSSVGKEHGDGDTSVDEGHGLSAIHETDEYNDDELSQNLSHSQMEDNSGTLDSEHSQEGCRPRERHREEDYEEAEDSDDYLSDSEENDGQMPEFQVVTGGNKQIGCPEDEDFLSAFDKMLADNIQARNQESLKVPQLDIAVPMQLKGKAKKFNELGQDPPEPTENKAIDFVLMTRRGNKQQFSTLHVPMDAEFAAKFKEREEAERAEKEKMKQVVLGIHERQEEEDYQELLASLNRQAPINTNRERRIHYQHPKGAPDADLIFGSKKR